MKDISKNSDDNLGGIFRFRYIPISFVLENPKPVNGVVYEPLKIKGYNQWLDFYATPGTIGFTEGKEKTKHGSFYKAKLVGNVPKDRTSLIEVFIAMQNEKFIIDYTDNNGFRKLIGTLDEPLMFRESLDTGINIPNKNSTSFEFYGDLRFKSPEYSV